MNPITHILSGWCLAELAAPRLNWREKSTIVGAAVVSDIDGIGFVAELATRGSARPMLWWSEYHHVLCHNLLFAAMIALLGSVIADKSRKLVAALAFIAVHIHIVGDVVGSRGPDGYQWPIPYLYPFSNALQLTWSGQWYLNAWPNILLTFALVAITCRLAWQRGYSLVGIVSRRADEAFVQTLRSRFES